MNKRSLIIKTLVGAGVVIVLFKLFVHVWSQNYLNTENSNFNKLRIKSELDCEKMPLHCLARDEDAEKISKYANAGKDLELKDNWGKTALFWALDKEKYHIVANLLALKANPNTKDEDGKTIFYRTIELDKFEIAGMLLEYGAYINMPSGNEYPETSLHFCVMNNRLKCVQFLLVHGANKHLKDSFGYTVFDRVKTHKHIAKEISEALAK